MSKDWDPYEGVDSWDEMTSIERLRYVHADDEGDTARVEVERMAEQLRELREVTQRAERQLASDPAPSTYAAGAMQKLRAALARGGTTE